MPYLQVVREAYPDMTAQDSSSKYFDAKASPDNPRWFMVDFKLVGGRAGGGGGILDSITPILILMLSKPALQCGEFRGLGHGSDVEHARQSATNWSATGWLSGRWLNPDGAQARHCQDTARTVLACDKPNIARQGWSSN